MTSDRPIVPTARANAICQIRRSSPARGFMDRSAPPDRVGTSLAFLARRIALQTCAMSMRLERSYRFEAAHFLPRVPPGHKCARMHGHSYRIEITIEGELDERGWVMDFAEIDEHVAPLVRLLD